MAPIQHEEACGSGCFNRQSQRFGYFSLFLKFAMSFVFRIRKDMQNISSLAKKKRKFSIVRHYQECWIRPVKSGYHRREPRKINVYQCQLAPYVGDKKIIRLLSERSSTNITLCSKMSSCPEETWDPFEPFAKKRQALSRSCYTLYFVTLPSRFEL